MLISEGLARLFFWSCIFWPLIGGIVVATLEYPHIRVRIHHGFLIVLLLLTGIAVISPRYMSNTLWVSDDDLTRFARFLVAIGGVVSAYLLQYWYPQTLRFSNQDKRLRWALALQHFLLAIVMLCVAVNNLFIALLCLFVILIIFIIGAGLNPGYSNLNIGWTFFRINLALFSLAFLGRLLLLENNLTITPTISYISSVLLDLGLGLGAGLFPICFMQLRLVKELPLSLGIISTFSMTLPYFITLIRLNKVPAYMPVSLFMIFLGFVTLFVLVMEIRGKHYNYLSIASVFLTNLVLMAIFSGHQEGLYAAGLFMVALVILNPLNYIIERRINSEEFSLQSSWLKLALSGLPPFGIFTALLILLGCFLNFIPLAGCILFILIIWWDYNLFYNRPFNLFVKETNNRAMWIIWGCILLQTLFLPFLFSNLLHNISTQFTIIPGFSG